MSHKIAKRVRKILRAERAHVTHGYMLKTKNERIKTMVLPDLKKVSFTTFTVFHAEGSYRNVYQRLKRELRV